jgi:predicted sulfurtransferase
MKEITLSVDEQNVEIVMTILNSLKADLISKIELDGTVTKAKHTQYQPKVKAVDEKDSGPNDRSGKYVSPAAYKERLKRSRGV